ncbi:unnamed protein product [Toxocara canis]|uniref:Uncharacterized protein n=1 Tax=Toxocara canis TaxID=6265 RepID=A0A183TW32_TOXCA|nr:unnamed protein product [Toxocara canis]
MEASVTRQSGQLPLRQVQFMTLRETRRGRRLPRDTAIIALLSLVYSATVQPLITAFMLTSDIQLAALPLMFTVAIVQMGSMLYLHSIFILFSFILSGILHGSLKTIFQAYTVHLAKRNIFARPNFIYDSNRLFMFFGIAKALELIGNALGFFIIAGGVLERHGGDNGVMSIEFCRELGGAIAFLVRLHPCMREKVIAASVIICASISPFLFKQLIKKRSAAQQHLSSVSL